MDCQKKNDKCDVLNTNRKISAALQHKNACHFFNSDFI